MKRLRCFTVWLRPHVCGFAPGCCHCGFYVATDRFLVWWRGHQGQPCAPACVHFQSSQHELLKALAVTCLQQGSRQRHLLPLLQGLMLGISCKNRLHHFDRLSRATGVTRVLVGFKGAEVLCDACSKVY